MGISIGSRKNPECRKNNFSFYLPVVDCGVPLVPLWVKSGNAGYGLCGVTLSHHLARPRVACTNYVDGKRATHTQGCELRPLRRVSVCGNRNAQPAAAHLPEDSPKMRPKMGSSPSVCLDTRGAIVCRALSRRASVRRLALSPLPLPRPRPTPGGTRHRAPPREPSWQLPRTRTRVARHTPHTVPELAHAHRVAHFRRHTSFTSCGHAALTTSPPTHSPHTGARPAPVVGAPPLIRLAPSVPHVQLPLSLAHAWPHPQRLSLGSQRRLSSPLSSLRISRQPCENSPRRSMRQQTPRTRSPRRRPGRRTSWRWRGCARAGRAG